MNCKLPAQLSSTLMATTFALFLGAGSARAIQVDTELVVLVDAQASSSSDFDLIIEGVARSFEQQSFIDSVAAGSNGSIAASLVLFNNNGETTAIPWMQLSSAADLQAFATDIRTVTQPNAFGNVDYAGAIAEGAAQIASSVFEGSLRQLTLIDDGTGFFAANRRETRLARNAALGSSVDAINAVVFDVAFRERFTTNFFNNSVVGGENAGVQVIGSPQGGAKSATDLLEIERAITGQVTEATIVAASAVPEPSSALLLLGALALWTGRRKR